MQRAIKVKEIGKITSNLFCSFFGDKSSNKIFDDKQGGKEYLSIKLLLSNWRSYSTLGVAFDWEIRIKIRKCGFRILKWNAKSENGFHLWETRAQGGLQLRNPNPDFMDFPFTVRLGNPKNDYCKTILVNSGLLFTNYACICKTADLKDSFSNPFSDFPMQP